MSNVVEVLKSRGFVEDMTDDELAKVVSTPRKFYIGFDPTAESLHLGNLVGIIAATWFQKFGHTPYFLVGGATGRIGDPSGKSSERPLLTEEELDKNVAKLKSFFEQFLDCECEKTRPVIINNNDWFSQILFTDFMRDVGKLFRVGPMLAKDAVKSRLQSEEGMSFTELSYQLLQGYDFYYLKKHHDVDLQLGGSDQWGNITAGIEYTKKRLQKTVYGFTFPLLTRSDGKKFGKSEGGAVWLSSEMFSPYKFYQYLYRVPDADVIRLLKIFTFIDLEEICQLENDLNSGTLPPNAAQKLLAEEVTKFVHGEEGLSVAIRVSEAMLPGSSAMLDPEILKEVIHDMPSANMNSSDVLECKYTDVVVKANLLASKGEVSRLIKNGGAYLNNIKVTDVSLLVKSEDLIGGKFLLVSAGKKKRMLISVE